MNFELLKIFQYWYQIKFGVNNGQ